MTVAKLQCEAQITVSCNNQIVRRVQGPKKGDPKFNCCIGCRAYLARYGTKVKDIK